MGWLDKFIVSERGQWDYPGQPTAVPTEDGLITMKGVPYPVYAQDNTGYSQMMYPGGEYQFPGNMVYEIPMAQDGMEMPFGLPLRSANPSAPYAYESPVANGYLLPDPNRPELLNTGATEYKMGIDDAVIPTVVNGNYMSPYDAYARYLITGEKFIPTANPESYSRFYDTISQLGLMKQQRGGDPSIPDLSNRGWLDKYQYAGQTESKPGPWIANLPKEEFKPKPNIPVYEDPIKKGYVAKQVPGVHGSMKTVYVNPKTQDVIETPEETKKQMAMNQIARSNNIDPIGVGILAASGAAPLARTVSTALPFLDAPLTIGSTVVPGVTAGNIIGAAGAGYSTAQVLDPNSELRTNPNAENILTTGLGFVGVGLGKGLMSGARQTGKYLFNTPKQLPGLANTGPVINTTRNLDDLKFAQQFAEQYGYDLPSNLERIAQSDVLTDRTIRGLVSRHNTFLRGVSTNWDELQKKLISEHGADKGKELWNNIVQNFEAQGIDYINNPKAAAEYMATHVPIDTGYGRASLDKAIFDQGYQALYSSNSFPTAEGYTYGQGFITKVRRPVDFSSTNRQAWITENQPKYYEHEIPGGNAINVDGKNINMVDLDIPQLYTVSDYDNINDLKGVIITDLEKLADRQKDVYERALNRGTNETYIDNAKKSYDNTLKQIEDIKNQKWERGKIDLERNILKTEHEPINKTFGENYGDFGHVAEDIAGKLSASTAEAETHSKKLIEITKNVGKQYKKRMQDLFYEEAALKSKGEQNLSDAEKIRLNQIDEEYLMLKQQGVNDVEAIQFKYLDENFPGWQNKRNQFAHYIHIGKPGEKVLEPLKSWEITPETWHNRSRAHSNRYTKKFSAMQKGGWLDKYN